MARLGFTGGLDVAALLGVLANHLVPGAERLDEGRGSFTRLLTVRGSRVAVTVTPADDHVRVAWDGPPALATDVSARVRFWLDLDADLPRIEDALSQDPLLAGLVSARPGLRVVRHPEPFEAAVGTVLGQQVSLAGGRVLAGRLVREFGTPGPADLLAFPTPAALAAVPTQELRAAVGLTGARAAAITALATACADGLRIDPDGDHAAIRRRLLELPGIGAWTVDYLTVRALADPDAFTPSDLVLRRALGGATPADAAHRSEAWRPYRAYALAHLWAEGVGQ